LPDDEKWGAVGEPPKEPFEAAGFEVAEVEWDNRPIRWTRFPVPCPDDENPRLARFQACYDFVQAIGGAESEFERLLLLREWVHRQIPSGQPVIPTSDPFEILDTAAQGGTFYCTHYSIVFQACAVACGWVGRMLGIDSDHTTDEPSTHHGVDDVFVNELGKWVAMDSHHDVHYEKDGVPLSPWEIAQEYVRSGGKDVDVCGGLEREKVAGSNKVCLPGKHESCCYFWCLHQWHADPLRESGSWKPRLRLVLVGDAHDRKTWYQGAPPETRPHVCYSAGSFQFTRREADVYPAVGPCRIELSKGERPGTVRVRIGTFTPAFEALLLKTDGGDSRPAGLSFDWYLHEGENRLAVRTRNQLGALGKESTLRAVLKKS